MYPYRVQQVIRERGKDEVVNVRDRASIYQTIERLHRDGLIAVAETARDERRPERTVYELTDDGRETVCEWEREMLSTPAQEFPLFPAALAFLPLLAPEDALRQLDRRALLLQGDLARLEALDASIAHTLPRLFLIEDEYRLAMLRTELAWVRAVADDVRAGRLTWSAELFEAVLAQQAAHDHGPREAGKE